MSEAGYYLATLEASIQHLSEAKVESVNDRNSQLFPSLSRGPNYVWM